MPSTSPEGSRVPRSHPGRPGRPARCPAPARRGPGCPGRTLAGQGGPHGAQHRPGGVQGAQARPGSRWPAPWPLSRQGSGPNTQPGRPGKGREAPGSLAATTHRPRARGVQAPALAWPGRPQGRKAGRVRQQSPPGAPRIVSGFRTGQRLVAQRCGTGSAVASKQAPPRPPGSRPGRSAGRQGRTHHPARAAGWRTRSSAGRAGSHNVIALCPSTRRRLLLLSSNAGTGAGSRFRHANWPGRAENP